MMIVRRASSSEIGAVIAVWLSANAGTRLLNHPENLRRWAQDPDTRVFVIDEDGAVTGAVLSLPGRADDGRGDIITGLRHLTGLAVHPECQGIGRGKQLLDHAIVDARNTGCTRVTLWTHPSADVALRIFEARGFRTTGRTQVDEAGDTMILLELAL